VESFLWTTKGEVQKPTEGDLVNIMLKVSRESSHVAERILGCREEGIFAVTKGSFVAATDSRPFGHVDGKERNGGPARARGEIL
jgi:hypothetical protein